MKSSLMIAVFAVLCSAAPAAASADDAALTPLAVSFADLRKTGIALAAPSSKEAVMTPAANSGPYGNRRGWGPGNGGWNPGNGGGYGRRDCRGYDNGYEEHWGGHGGMGWDPMNACRECRARHGSCTYRCTIPAYQCRAEWQGADGARQQYEGRPHRDRYAAEDDAVARCRDANWNNRDQGQCRPLDCRQADEVVEQGRCR